MAVFKKKGHPSKFPKMSISAAAEFLDIAVQSLHKQIKAKNLKCPKVGNKFFITHSVARELFDIQFKKQIVVAQIVKGGTGKTTTIDHIASCANAYGARVLMIDADPQGNLTDANDVNAEEFPVLIDVIKGDVDSIRDCIVPVSEGLDIIPSRIENVVLDNEIVNARLPLDKLYSNLMEGIQDDYDFIFIDCPPTMGQAVTAASLYADTILAPLNPDKFSAKGLEILKNEIRTLNRSYKKRIDFKVYLNKFSQRTILSDKAIISLISDPDLEGCIISTSVQYSQEIPNITSDNKNVFDMLKKSSVRQDFDMLARELLDIKPNVTKRGRGEAHRAVERKEYA